MTFDWKNPAAMGMTITGGVLLLAALVVDRFVPPVSSKSLGGITQQRNDVFRTVINSSKAAQSKQLDAKQKLWTDPDEKITPTALSRVNATAQKCNVKVTAFRPEKAIVAGTLNILPYFVSVEGTFANAMQFEHEMEENDPLLAVSMVQIASADSSTSGVTASITLNAYVDPKRASQSAALASSTSKSSRAKGAPAAEPSSTKPTSPKSTGAPVAKTTPQTSVSIDKKPATTTSGTEADRMNKQETTHG